MKLPEKTVIAYTVKELMGACIGFPIVFSLIAVHPTVCDYLFFLSVGSELNFKDDDELEADGGTLPAELISNESMNCLDKVLEGMLSFTGWCMLLGSPSITLFLLYVCLS